jgi:putative chitinase
MNRATFFASVRKNPFNGSLSQSQVMGLDAIFDAAEKLKVTDLRMIAYAMATPMIETGGTYEPITENLNYSTDALKAKFGNRISAADAQKYGRNSAHPANQEAIANIIYGGEWGKANLGNTQPGDGWKYRGRSLVQVTGRNNYTKFGLADNPEDAAHIKTAADIMVKGMRDGLFTGKKFSDYFTASKEDFVQARRMINSLDKADEIAKHARTFYAALKGAA